MCTDAYLGTKSKLGTIGKAGGSVPIDASRVGHLLEAVSGNGIVGDDALAMARAKTCNVRQRLVERAVSRTKWISFLPPRGRQRSMYPTAFSISAVAS